MEALRIAGFALTAATLCLLVRSSQPELASLVSLAAGAMVLLFALGSLTSVTGTLQRIASQSGIESGYLAALLKVMGVAYLTELAAQACLDLGEAGLAAKVGLCGKTMLLAIAAPILGKLLEMILSLAP